MFIGVFFFSGVWQYYWGVLCFGGVKGLKKVVVRLGGVV